MCVAFFFGVCCLMFGAGCVMVASVVCCWCLTLATGCYLHALYVVLDMCCLLMFLACCVVRVEICCC